MENLFKYWTKNISSPKKDIVSTIPQIIVAFYIVIDQQQIFLYPAIRFFPWVELGEVVGGKFYCVL